MTVTRTPLNRCSVKDCHFPEEEHYCWAQFPHGCSGSVTHQHWPKKGMGGRNSKSQVVAILCAAIHDTVDNGHWYKNEVVTRNGRRYYRLWKPADEHKPEGWALVWKEIPQHGTQAPMDAGGEGDGAGGMVAGERSGQGTEHPDISVLVYGVETDHDVARLRQGDETDGNPAPGQVEETHGQGTEGQGTAGLPGTLPDTGVPETAGRKELGENDGTRAQVAASEDYGGDGERVQPQNLRLRLRSTEGGDGLPVPDFGPDYLELPEEFTLQDAVPWAAMIGKWEHGKQFYAGDLLLACEARFGHERLWGHSLVDGKTFVDLLGMTYASLRNCQRVCEAFSPGERFPLSFGHHAAVYKHPERDRLMNDALMQGWTVSQLREEATGHVEPAKHDCPLCGAEHRVKELAT